MIRAQKIPSSPTYVSIDMDFWNESPARSYEEIGDFLGSLITLPKEKIVAVMNHQQLLPHVDASGASCLVNIDYHSDASSVTTLNSLNCGTWVSYVDWADKGTYVWVRPINEYYGDCNGTTYKVSNPDLRWRKDIGWRESVGIAKTKSIRIENLVHPDNVSGVGLCLSPAYIEDDVQEILFKALVKKFGIVYKRGIRHEGHEVARTPPVQERRGLNLSGSQQLYA